MKSSLTDYNGQLANMGEKLDTNFLEITSSIGQIKRGLARFFERFAEQFSDGEAGSGGEEGPGGDDSTLA